MVERLREFWLDLDDRSRRLLTGVGFAVVLVIIMLAFFEQRIDSLQKRLTSRERDLAEMMILRQRYREAKSGSDAMANRLAAIRGDDTPARIVEETGIRGGGVRVTPLKSEEAAGLRIDLAEARFESLTPNEVVNLLHRLEYGQRAVVVNRAVVKTRFNDPSRLDLLLTVGLVRPAGGTQ
jgi:general secretion pathway protein M